MPKLTWEPSRVGCYWDSGEFHIGTRVAVENGKQIFTYPQSGYCLMRNREELGLYKTLKSAQRAAEKVSD